MTIVHKSIKGSSKSLDLLKRIVLKRSSILKYQ